MRREPHLFDSSAIITLIEKNKLDALLEGLTIDLSFYELGNSVWKQVNLYKTLSMDDAKVVLDAFMLVYNRMNKIQEVDPQSILTVASQEGITFYDAAYLQAAKDKKVTLVTDDKKLKQASSKYVNTVTSREVS